MERRCLAGIRNCDIDIVFVENPNILVGQDCVFQMKSIPRYTSLQIDKKASIN